VQPDDARATLLASFKLHLPADTSTRTIENNTGIKSNVLCESDSESRVNPDLSSSFSFNRKPELVASCLVCGAITLRANRLRVSYQASLISFCSMGAIHGCGPLEKVPLTNDNPATRDYSGWTDSSNQIIRTTMQNGEKLHTTVVVWEQSGPSVGNGLLQGS
jgi:hypothetical protein